MHDRPPVLLRSQSSVTVFEDTFEGALSGPLPPSSPPPTPRVQTPLVPISVTIIDDSSEEDDDGVSISPPPLPSPRELTTSASASPPVPRMLSDISQDNWIPRLDEYWDELKKEESKKYPIQEFIDLVPNQVIQAEVLFDPTEKPVSEIQILKAINFRTNRILEQNVHHGYCWAHVVLIFSRILSGKKLTDLYETYKALILFSKATLFSKRQEIFFNLVCLEWVQRCHWFYKKNNNSEYISFRDIDIILSKLTGLPIIKIESSKEDTIITREGFIPLLEKLNPQRAMTLYSYNNPKNPGTHGVGIFCDINGDINIVNGNFKDCMAQRVARKHLASVFDIVEKNLYLKKVDARPVDGFKATFDIVEGPKVVPLSQEARSEEIKSEPKKQSCLVQLSLHAHPRTRHRMLPTDEELSRPSAKSYIPTCIVRAGKA